MTLKLYPSMYQPLHGTTTNPTFKDGCLRHIMLKATGAIPREGDIDPLYKAVGRMGEERFLATALEDFSREVPCSWDLGDEECITRTSGSAPDIYADLHGAAGRGVLRIHALYRGRNCRGYGGCASV